MSSMDYVDTNTNCVLTAAGYNDNDDMVVTLAVTSDESDNSDDDGNDDIDIYNHQRKELPQITLLRLKWHLMLMLLKPPRH
eukprot:5364300-Ditylum_brightwellii.AAC.1